MTHVRESIDFFTALGLRGERHAARRAAEKPQPQPLLQTPPDEWAVLFSALST
jgi:hypothetical protein